MRSGSHGAMQLADPKGSYDDFLKLATFLVSSSIEPLRIDWVDSVTGLPSLFQPTVTAGHGIDSQPKVASAHDVRSMLGRAGELAACHTDDRRWELLYRILWRMVFDGERSLLGDVLDSDVRELERLARTVRRDVHKMKAFVRFRKVKDDTGERYVAWHRPDHRILQIAAPFFVRRFGSMRWTIFTPTESADWKNGSLTFGDGVPADAVAGGDQVEELWKTYYASIFNPARIKIGAMVKEMPRRYWATLPEASIIEQLLDEAPDRVRRMVEAQSNGEGAKPFLPDRKVSLPVLRAEAQGCVGCGIAEMATQTVFGEGPNDASVMLISEQPGDEEDLAGRPFVGPSGQILDEALAKAGLRRSELYVTNAVKHFKYEPRGERRIHRRASMSEIRACSPWLDREIDLVDPDLIVLLGSVAGQSLFGAGYRVNEHRGSWLVHPKYRSRILSTVHPSMILRMPLDQYSIALSKFVDDLRKVHIET